MAHFSRTRRLNLGRLETQPPDDLTMVHTILLGAVKDIQEKVKKIERNFYGKAEDAEGEIKKWLNSINSVLRDVRMPYFNCAGQIDDIVGYIMEPSRKMNVNIYDINRLKECLKKVLDAVPGKFSSVIEELKKVCFYMEKYCLSFYDLDGEVYLDTCHNYENQRLEYLREINRCIASITYHVDKFNGTGVFINEFGSQSQEVARKALCTNAPFLLIFPEACTEVRNTCAIMLTLLAADANYAAFLSNDIVDLDARKAEAAKAVRTHQHRFHKLSFRLRQSEAEFAKLCAETTRLDARQDELLVDEERLMSETNEIMVDVEMKEYKRDELIKKATTMHTEVLYDKYSLISEQLKALKFRLPFLKRQLAAVQHKLNWIKDKKREVAEAEKELGTIQEDMIELEAGKQEEDNKLNNASRGLDLAKQIHLYKTSTDVLSRIFHDQPVITTNTTKKPTGKRITYTDDAFDKACEIVAVQIESDWPRLYRNLPFHPLRGTKTIDSDISEMSYREMRDGAEETAKRALLRWRRFHTRAKLEDLQSALRDIRRLDLVRHLEDILNPQAAFTDEDQISPEEEARLYNIDPYLLPFLKEVERFDQLRAANKI